MIAGHLGQLAGILRRGFAVSEISALILDL